MSSLARLAIWIALAVGIASSALLVVKSTREMGELHHAMQQVGIDHDKQLMQQSRLLLERSAKVALPGVERTAVEQLGMEFPARITRIEP